MWEIGRARSGPPPLELANAQERDALAPGGRRVPSYRERPEENTEKKSEKISYRKKYFLRAGTCELLFQSVAGEISVTSLLR